MAFGLWCHDHSVVFICVYRPLPGFSIDDLLLHLHNVLKSLEKAGTFEFALLRGLTHGSWVVVYAVQEATSKDECSSVTGSQMEALQQQISQVANTIDCSRYSLCCGEHKEQDSIAELSKGDAVHFRWIQTNPQRQGTLTYSCFAILKAFLHKVEGLRSCTFYTSLDGTKIAGLGVWENAQAAYGFISPPGSPAEPYWKSLGAKLRCGICEVVYVTSG